LHFDSSPNKWQIANSKWQIAKAKQLTGADKSRTKVEGTGQNSWKMFSVKVLVVIPSHLRK